LVERSAFGMLEMARLGVVGSGDVVSMASTFGDVFLPDVPSFFFGISNLPFENYRLVLLEKFN
jgi:hypothetical protein